MTARNLSRRMSRGPDFRETATRVGEVLPDDWERQGNLVGSHGACQFVRVVCAKRQGLCAVDGARVR